VDERKRDRNHILPGPIVDRQEEKKSRGKKEHKILVLVWSMQYLPAFIFCNLHRVQNTIKSFLQEFSFFTWLA
jgi:hypothetical protein